MRESANQALEPMPDYVPVCIHSFSFRHGSAFTLEIMKVRINNFAFWCKDEATHLRICQIIDDPEQFGPSYQAWLDRAEKSLDAFAKKGMFYVKVNADPDEFSEWCRINSHRPDQRARLLFAAVKGDSKRGRG